MFDKNDARAKALLEIVEGRVAAEASPSETAWFVDGIDASGGMYNWLVGGGFAAIAEGEGQMEVTLTRRGKNAAIATFGSSVLEAVEGPQALLPLPTLPGLDGYWITADTIEGTGSGLFSFESDEVTVEYLGLAPHELDFVNGPEFRDAVARNGLTIALDLDGKETLAVDQPLTMESRLWVGLPGEDAWMAVLYDDEEAVTDPSEGFVEILRLMDGWSKEKHGSRLFIDPEDDEAADIDREHPLFDAEYDFTAGSYRRAADDRLRIDYFGLAPEDFEFVNGKPFRDLVAKHGFTIRMNIDDEDYQEDLPLDRPLTEDGLLWVGIPERNEWLAVLYDDGDILIDPSEGFIEILKLMDVWFKDRGWRLFAETGSGHRGAIVGRDHRLFNAEFDFTTGRYIEP